MATLTHQCPHCETSYIALRIVACSGERVKDQCLHLSCPRCGKPSSAVVNFRDQQSASMLNIYMDHDGDLSDELRVDAFWPTPPSPEVPLYLPEAIERCLLQAESNYRIVGNEEAAGMMYRKALDVGLAAVDADVKGTLYDRINKLAERHLITPALAQWAHQIRVLGNESAHDAEAPTRDDLASLRNFTSLVMQYLFTLPKMVEMRKADGAGDVA